MNNENLEMEEFHFSVDFIGTGIFGRFVHKLSGIPRPFFSNTTCGFSTLFASAEPVLVQRTYFECHNGIPQWPDEKSLKSSFWVSVNLILLRQIPSVFLRSSSILSANAIRPDLVHTLNNCRRNFWCRSRIRIP